MLDCFNSDLRLHELQISMAHFSEDLTGNKGKNALTFYPLL